LCFGIVVAAAAACGWPAGAGVGNRVAGGRAAARLAVVLAAA